MDLEYSFQNLSIVNLDLSKIEVVSMQLVEKAKDDIGEGLAQKHGVTLHHSIASTLCRGGDTLAVARDPEISRQRTDPEYQAALQRINDYVRSTCAT